MEPRDLSDHEPYRAGRGIEEVAREYVLDPSDLIKLSSNENDLGPSPRAVKAIKQHAGGVHRYPKSSHTDLIEKLAGEWNLSERQVWLSNSGDAALDYIARALIEPGDRVLVPRPGFAYYPMSVRYHHGKVNQYRLSKDDDFALTPETVLSDYSGERIVYVNTPHNPTGSEMPLEAVETVAAETRGSTLVLVDEAYGEFTDTTSKVELVRRRDDVAVLRTFSKAYGLAGMRLGYLLVPEEWASAYDRINTPFATGELTCRAGLAALDDEEHLQETTRMVREARRYLRDKLQIRTWPSGGNFVLADVDGAETVTETAKKQGVIVRDCSSFGLPDCIRITCGTSDHMEVAVEVINSITGD